jgi:hypothetical protein
MPVDLLAAEWFLSRTAPGKTYHHALPEDKDAGKAPRLFFAYRYNLLTHIGYTSTFGDRKQRKDAGCSDVLKVCCSPCRTLFSIS